MVVSAFCVTFSLIESIKSYKIGISALISVLTFLGETYFSKLIPHAEVISATSENNPDVFFPTKVQVSLNVGHSIGEGQRLYVH